MINLLEDKYIDEYPRIHAMIVLGKISDRKAVEPLRRALNDANSECVKGQAVQKYLNN